MFSLVSASCTADIGAADLGGLQNTAGGIINQEKMPSVFWQVAIIARLVVCEKQDWAKFS